MIVAGFGCRPGCRASEIIALLRRAEALAGESASVLAAPDFRVGEHGLQEAATRLRLPLRWPGHAVLLQVQPRCVTRSERARRETGLASVAEACALALAGPRGALVLPRIASRHATCALARTAPL